MPNQIIPGDVQEAPPNFAQLWASLSANQKRFCIARLSHSSDTAAAHAVHISPNTVRDWPTKKQVDQVVALMLSDQVGSAQAMMLGALERAVAVKLEGLDSSKPEIAQAAATELLDRVLGRAVQRVAPTNPAGTEAYQPGSTPEADERMLARLEELAAKARQRKLAHEQSIKGMVQVLTPAEAAEDHE